MLSSMDEAGCGRMDLLERALDIAVRCHRGQRDKGGFPYLLHVVEVVRGCRGNPEAMVVAALHDCVEDGGTSLETLAGEGFPAWVLGAVDALTRREGETWEAYLERVKRDPLARRVKRADLESNLDVRRLPQVEARSAMRLERYRKAWEELAD